MDIKKISTRCCIAGGGPAGVMLGYLLARAGIDTIVLEKWPDFFRDFRGDTIHPSTLEILYELGLLEEFLKLPHNKTTQIAGEIGNQKVILADFSALHVRCPYIAFIPQWDFLKFISEQASRYPTFHLRMQTEVVDLIQKNDQIVGVYATSEGEKLEIRADVVIGADGRHSIVREKGGFAVESLSAPMDVLWFRLSRKETDSKDSFGKINLGRMMVLIERGDYWQCGFLIRKGQYDVIHEQGLQAFRNQLIEMFPAIQDRVNELESWDQIKLLTVTVDRLKKWCRPGLLCIGDSAHAMSPIGGVGINLAIQDAVAAANILVPAFLTNTLTEDTLIAVQKRREFPAKLIQRIQVFIQSHVIDRVLGNALHPKVPLLIKLLQWFPYLRRVPAYLIGIGFRPEHVNYKSKKL